MAELCVCFTMDVERIRPESPTGGPVSWEAGEASVRSYCDYLGGCGYPVTMFIAPEAGERQRTLFRGLRCDGHECGMHLHPHSWRDHYRDPDAHEYLGAYPPEIQHAILDQARNQLADALGFAPMAFRPGNFSANDDTFVALDAVGFLCGSVSQPGRCVPKLRAVWTGATRAVHRAHRAFRLIPGDLDFVEVPLTVGAIPSDHWTGVEDTRFEDREASDVLRAIEATLQWQTENNAQLKHLCFFTHNFVSYDDNDAAGPSRLPVLRSVLEGIPEVADQFGLEPQGCTVSAAAEAFRAGDQCGRR